MSKKSQNEQIPPKETLISEQLDHEAENNTTGNITTPQDPPQFRKEHTDGTNMQKSERFFDRVIDWAYKIISISMIPLIVWIFSVERRISAVHTEIALQKQRNQQIQEKLKEFRTVSREINRLVSKNNLALTKFSGDFDLVNLNIKQIRKSIQRLDKLGDKLDALLRKK